jgi:hypothetical protein
MCTPTGERLDVQRLRVVPVDPIADTTQQREVAQALLGGATGHLGDAATASGANREYGPRHPDLNHGDSRRRVFATG